MIKIKDVPEKSNLDSIEMVAIVARVGDLKIAPQTPKTTLFAREIYIYDDSYTIIKLIVRDPRTFDNRHFKAENILFLKNVRPLRVRQQYLVLVTLPESIITHEIDTPEAKSLRSWFLLKNHELLSCGFKNFYNLSSPDGSFTESVPFDDSSALDNISVSESVIVRDSTLSKSKNHNSKNETNTNHEGVKLKSSPTLIKQEKLSTNDQTLVNNLSNDHRLLDVNTIAFALSRSKRSVQSPQSPPNSQNTTAGVQLNSQPATNSQNTPVKKAIPRNDASQRISPSQISTEEPPLKYMCIGENRIGYISTPKRDTQQKVQNTIQSPSSPTSPLPKIKVKINTNEVINVSDDETDAEKTVPNVEQPIKIEEEDIESLSEEPDVAIETFNALMTPVTVESEWTEEKDKHLVNYITKNLNNLQKKGFFETVIAEKSFIFEGTSPAVLKSRMELLASVKNYFYLMLLCGGTKIKSEKEKYVFINRVENLRKIMKSLLKDPME